MISILTALGLAGILWVLALWLTSYAHEWETTLTPQQFKKYCHHCLSHGVPVHANKANIKKISRNDLPLYTNVQWASPNLRTYYLKRLSGQLE